VFSATSAARERSVSRIVASTALVISRSIQREYPAVCSRPGSLRHEHRQDPRHFQVRTEYLRRTRPFGQQRSSTDCARHVRSVCLGETDQQDLFAKAIDQAEAELERLTRAQAEARAKVAALTLLIQKGSRPSVFTGMCTRRSHRSRSVTQGASG
jgi:ribosome-associated translation inhibitor RaiA